MKKLLALILVICCMLSVVSCNKDKDSDDDAVKDPEVAAYLERFTKLLNESVPTNSETVVTHDVNDMIIENTFVLNTGYVKDGGEDKKAATYETTVTTLRKVEDRYLEPERATTESTWYVEGRGTKKSNSSRWDTKGEDFSPVAGSLAMELKESYLISSSYKKEGALETLTLKMSGENATLALKNFLDEEQKIDHQLVDGVTVVITAAADRISSITISYTIEEQDLGDDNNSIFVQASTVTISAKYSYKTDMGDLMITLG